MKWVHILGYLVLFTGAMASPAIAQNESEQSAEKRKADQLTAEQQAEHQAKHHAALQAEKQQAEKQRAEEMMVEKRLALQLLSKQHQATELMQEQQRQAQTSDELKSKKLAVALTVVFDLQRQIEQMGYTLQQLSSNLESLEKLENIVFGHELETRQAFLASAEEFGKKARLHLEVAAKEMKDKMQGQLQASSREALELGQHWRKLEENGLKVEGTALKAEAIAEYLKALADRAHAEHAHDHEEIRHAEGFLLPPEEGALEESKHAVELAQAQQLDKAKRFSSEMAAGLELAQRHRSQLEVANLALKLEQAQAEIARAADLQARDKVMSQTRETQGQALELARTQERAGSDDVKVRIESLESRLERIEQLLRKLAEDK